MMQTDTGNHTYINGFEKYMDMLEIEGTTGELRMVYSILEKTKEQEQTTIIKKKQQINQ